MSSRFHAGLKNALIELVDNHSIFKKRRSYILIECENLKDEVDIMKVLKDNNMVNKIIVGID